MSSFKKRITSNNFKWIVTFGLILILSISLIFAFVKINRNEDTKTLGSNSLTYSIGLLDEEGEYVQGTSSIYLKDFESVDGLTIDVEDKATVTYKLFFYNADKEFLESTEELSADFDSSTLPEGAEYFKVMITPTNDAEVSLFEISTYAGQLAISVNK